MRPPITFTIVLFIGATAVVWSERPRCRINPCNNGECFLIPGDGDGYKCECPKGFSGETCQRSKDFTQSDKFQNSTYYLSTTDSNLFLHDMAEKCKKAGGYLAEINDDSEYLFLLKFLKETIPNGGEALHGATHAQLGFKGWKYWTSGGPVTWYNWAHNTGTGGYKKCMSVQWNVDVNDQGMHMVECHQQNHKVRVLCEACITPDICPADKPFRCETEPISEVVVVNSYVCDRYPRCLAHNDKCTSQYPRCLASNATCDGNRDCKQGDDEINCTESSTTQTTGGQGSGGDNSVSVSMTTVASCLLLVMVSAAKTSALNI